MSSSVELQSSARPYFSKSAQAACKHARLASTTLSPAIAMYTHQDATREVGTA